MYQGLGALLQHFKTAKADKTKLKTINGQSIDGEGNIIVTAAVTKQSVEAVLTGEISTHTHPASTSGLTQQRIEGMLWEY